MARTAKPGRNGFAETFPLNRDVRRTAASTDRSPARPPSPGRHAAVIWLAGAGLLASALHSDGQATVSTVRENEFRSRWADYQVDRPPPTAAQAEEENSVQQAGGLLNAFGRSFNDYFRDGPLQVRADLSAGYEFTNEQNLRRANPDGSNSSAFAAPALGVFYNLELRAVTISARYSVGYVYYLDQSYYAVNHNGGILSQTAALDIGVTGTRSNVRSNTSASYGNGNDIESGTFRDRLSISTTLDASYLVTDFTQIGTADSLTYATYGSGGVTDTETLSLNARFYADYVITGKSRLRLEFGVGDDHQSAGSASTSDRSYYQLLLKVSYVPSLKLSFDAGLGYGYQQDSAVVDRGSGSHAIYSLSARYVPTEKTLVSFHVGFEGADVEPDVSFQAQWQPRPNTNLAFSVYQSSNFSTYVVSQNLTSRGVLATVQQRFFEKIQIDFSTGAEQTRGYTATKTSGTTGSPGTYYFASVSGLWQFNSVLALQSYYRCYSGQPGYSLNDQGWQSRASLSLRLTF